MEVALNRLRILYEISVNKFLYGLHFLNKDKALYNFLTRRVEGFIRCLPLVVLTTATKLDHRIIYGELLPTRL